MKEKDPTIELVTSRSSAGGPCEPIPRTPRRPCVPDYLPKICFPNQEKLCIPELREPPRPPGLPPKPPRD